MFEHLHVAAVEPEAVYRYNVGLPESSFNPSGLSLSSICGLRGCWGRGVLGEVGGGGKEGEGGGRQNINTLEVRSRGVSRIFIAVSG